MEENIFYPSIHLSMCEVQQLTVFSSGQKGLKQWILNRFLLVNAEMWIRSAVCYSAVYFYTGGWRKTDILDSDGSKILD